MATEWITRINGESATWAAHLGYACAWGAAISFAAWLLCRPQLRLPAATRAWFWWLVCFKMVFDLCGISPLTLHVLPASNVAVTSPIAPIALMTPEHTMRPAPVSAVPFTASQESDGAQDRAGHLPPSFSGWTALQTFWLFGICASLVRLIGQAAQIGRRKAQALEDSALIAEASRLCTIFGLRGVPDLRLTSAVTTPCVVGPFRPAILLPRSITETLAFDEIRLAMAHEMAHLRRGDLLLAPLPALARSLFFFFPPAWLAYSEWATAREEACDALALRVTGESPARYGGLLLKIVSPGSHSPLSGTALGMASAYPALKRRLISLQTTPPRLTGLTRCLPLLVLPLLAPWRLTASSLPISAADAPAITRYEIRDLGTLGDSGAEAVSLNDSGQVVGNVRPVPGSLRSHGFFWSRGPLVPLTRQWNSLANGINNHGQIILSAYSTPGHPHALIWDGARHKLGSLPGFPYTQARGINAMGQVAGYAQTGGHDRWRALAAHAFLWNTGQMTDIGTLGGPYSYAYGINDAGTVVGKADTATFGETHAFAWTRGEMSDLGTLGGANSIAYHVNNAGQAVGSSETGAGDTRHAFLWSDGSLRDLGALSGTTRSAAYDINASGQVVGASDSRAFLWQNGQMTDLNSRLPAHSGWILESAKAINTQGQIAGSGLIGGRLHAFLLSPR